MENNDMNEYTAERTLTPPEDERLNCGNCAVCGEPIKEGDGFYHLLEDWFCEACVNENFEYAEYNNCWRD